MLTSSTAWSPIAGITPNPGRPSTQRGGERQVDGGYRAPRSFDRPMRWRAKCTSSSSKASAALAAGVHPQPAGHAAHNCRAPLTLFGHVVGRRAVAVGAAEIFYSRGWRSWADVEGEQVRHVIPGRQTRPLSVAPARGGGDVARRAARHRGDSASSAMRWGPGGRNVCVRDPQQQYPPPLSIRCLLYSPRC